MQPSRHNRRHAHYTGIVGILFFIFVLMNFPMAAVLHWSGLKQQGVNWRSVSGTLWQGRIESVSYGSHPIGNADVRIAFWPLLTGRLNSEIALRGAAVNAEGKVSLRLGNVLQVNDLAMVVDLARYEIRDIFESKMAGSLRLDIERLRLAGSACEEGEFSLWTDTLIYSARRYGGEGFPVSGDGFCEAGNLVLPLSGKGAYEEVMLEAVLQQDLDYTANVQVRSQTPGLADVLRLYGFEKRADRLTLIQRGNLLVNN